MGLMFLFLFILGFVIFSRKVSWHSIIIAIEQCLIIKDIYWIELLNYTKLNYSYRLCRAAWLKHKLNQIELNWSELNSTVIEVIQFKVMFEVEDKV